MRVFLSGGCKNGKSTYAQRLAKEQQNSGPLYYLATMRPQDSEDAARVARHRREREGLGFLTVELPTEILRCLAVCDLNGSFLLDSLTALLAGEMFRADGTVDAGAPTRVAAEVTALIAKTPNIAVVSDYIYSDAVFYDELTESYRRGLALVDRAAAVACDAVLEIAYGKIICHKVSGAGSRRLKGRGLLTCE